MAEEGYKVSLNVYDLSQGLARQLSSTFLGKVIEAIWHTGIVVYGNEYYFGGGIEHAPVGTTPYGTPVRVVDLGTTHVPKELFEDYLQEISPRYTSETYSLLTHNCNNFSNEVAQFLVGTTIPDYILELPNDVMSSPMGSLILPMIQRLETTLRAGAAPQPLQFKPPSALPQQPITHSKATTRTNPSTEQPTKSNPLTNLTPIKEAQQDSKPSSSQPVKVGGSAEDPLGTARSKVQEEISNEFAALMATGSLRASEAAALAARRVMERYGQMNIVVPQS